MFRQHGFAHLSSLVILRVTSFFWPQQDDGDVAAVQAERPSEAPVATAHRSISSENPGLPEPRRDSLQHDSFFDTPDGVGF